jgi:23S rRNA pseudouridine2605 synthase
LMLEGRVTVNGDVVRELGSKADPEADDIRVDGRAIRVATPRLYFLLNKPRGYVTTRADPEGRPTVIDLLTGVHRYVYPVGRLDYDSEGLLLLTNDGELAARLTHPRHEIAREYHARVRGLPDAHALRRLSQGIVLDGRKTAPAEVRLLDTAAGAARDQALVSITLHEGRTRQVRRMLEAVGHPVVRLRRVRIGPVSDPRLKLGGYRPLTASELRALRRATGLE